jgi:hypothetical protein
VVGAAFAEAAALVVVAVPVVGAAFVEGAAPVVG